LGISNEKEKRKGGRGGANRGMRGGTKDGLWEKRKKGNLFPLVRTMG